MLTKQSLILALNPGPGRRPVTEICAARRPAHIWDLRPPISAARTRLNIFSGFTIVF
jgi:hypothetical protein